MALFGVSSGAVQFMAYEQMKNVAFARKKRKTLDAGGSWREEEEKLVSVVLLLIPYFGKLV
jgi:solute carrier family 25 folate transporter 32